MVLSSQAPRPGMDRLYRVSGTRRRGRRPWFALLILLVLAVGLIYAITAFTGAGTPDAAEGDEITAENTPAQPENNTPTITFNGNTPATQPDNTPPAVDNQPDDPVIDNVVTHDPPPAVINDDDNAWSRVDPQQHPAVAQAANLIQNGDLVEARRLLSSTLYADDVPPKLLADALRGQLADVNATLVFSDQVLPGDEVAERYRIQPGDYLSRVGPKFNIPYQFIQDINGVDPNRIRAGQYLKVLRGPLHARVLRNQYMMDVFAKDPQGKPVHIIAFPVGLGENNSTPDGMWLVEPGRKVANPDWRNPRTGQYYQRDDPDNPIGEYWIALEGTDAATAGQRGYGIHGTIDPDSIGAQASMGCVRLRDEDIKLLYFMLSSGDSTVQIRP
ncbi:L,D-transpeptidase family protein [Mucisphaera calidilacus]|uniref:Putative L,D-transpeptidase ErfK/SrfK n=1 Tax=Mucisphaera calidilacus TaxID=2527982 RepID=A0A518BZ73_9BACT|nr:L,D-transpeptidase family protein [Mucisphaera calidilacus]QDU72273.1 putative L,D-transpeptidase ErfK/SrfK precursor [Mucisphaera calidilacus]